MKYDVKLAVLDMAGTTVKDDHEVEDCFAKAAKETGLQVSEEEILAAQGWAKRFVFETYWEKQIGERSSLWLEKVDYSYAAFRNILEDHYRTSDIYPTKGAEEIFQLLRSNDVKICLTTGFYRKVANIILDKLGWLDGLNERHVGNGDSVIFQSITSDEVPSGRPAPDMIFKAMESAGISDARQVIKIGDTPSDIKAGKRANCLLSMAVGNGTHTAEQLLPFEPDLILKSLCDLESVLLEKVT